MELLEKRHLLAANFSVNDAGDQLKINVQSSDASVYLRTRPGNHLLEYKTDPNDTWSSTFGGETVSLDKPFTIFVGTGLNPSADISDKTEAVVYLAGIETAGTDLDVTSSIDLSVAGDLLTGAGSLNLKIADTTNIFGGSLGHNSSKLTIGPLDSNLDNSDRMSDGKLTVQASDLKVGAKQNSQKSVKQVIGLDNIESSVLISDARIDVEGGIDIKSTASADLLGDEDGLWGTHFSQPTGCTYCTIFSLL